MLHKLTAVFFIDKPAILKPSSVLAQRLFISAKSSYNIFKRDPVTFGNEKQNLNAIMVRYSLQMPLYLPRILYFGHILIITSSLYSQVYKGVLITVLHICRVRRKVDHVALPEIMKRTSLPRLFTDTVLKRSARATFSTPFPPTECAPVPPTNRGAQKMYALSAIPASIKLPSTSPPPSTKTLMISRFRSSARSLGMETRTP